MLKLLYIMQQSPEMSNAMQFSAGLVIICLLLLMLLWLPDLLKR